MVPRAGAFSPARARKVWPGNPQEPAPGDGVRAKLIDRRQNMALNIVEKEVNGVSVLQLAGRVTLGEESSQLRTKLKDSLATGKTRLVLDLAEVSYIDSAGLGTLVAGYTSAQNQGANLKLANLTKRFKEQLNITKLVTVFEVFDTVEAAVKSFLS
jgi:anti-sigma B factor antagonist